MATGYIMLDSPNPVTPQGGYPRRSGFTPSGTCIVHTSEGAWSAGVDSLTNMVRSRADYGCYHRACDWQDVALYYPWEWECWQDSETNNWAVGIAAACRTEDWGNMPADVEDGFYRNMGRMAADFVAYMRDTYGVEVPRVRITGAQARAGVPGFCAHGDSGISRTDPGARFDWARFFDYTNQALGGVAAQGSATQEDDVTAKDVWEFPITINGQEYQAYDVLRYANLNAARGRELLEALPGVVVEAFLKTALPAPDGSGRSYTVGEYLTYGWWYSMQSKDKPVGELPSMDVAVIADAVSASVADAVGRIRLTTEDPEAK